MKGRSALLLALAVACAGGGGTTGPGSPAGSPSSVVLVLEGLRALDSAREGQLEAWAVDAAGTTTSLGRFTGADGRATLPLRGTHPVSLLVSIERGAAGRSAPSAQLLLRGGVEGGHATLGIAGALTPSSLPLREEPGQFTMFTPSDNAKSGYPSHEEAGIWLFNMSPRSTPQNDMWVRLTPLASGWVYEGWMVRDIDTPRAVWLSYGKFLPDAFGAVNSRDDTGWGPFSGVPDFLKGEEEFPGDDWISNPLGLTLPAGISLPLDLRERDAAGAFRWTHVITVEPATDRGEPYTTERPFLVRPYADPFGSDGPGVARRITYRASGVPRGTAELR